MSNKPMKQTIEIKVPEGWEWTGEIRLPTTGDVYLIRGRAQQCHSPHTREEDDPLPILRKIQPPQPGTSLEASLSRFARDDWTADYAGSKLWDADMDRITAAAKEVEELRSENERLEIVAAEGKERYDLLKGESDSLRETIDVYLEQIEYLEQKVANWEKLSLIAAQRAEEEQLQREEAEKQLAEAKEKAAKWEQHEAKIGLEKLVGPIETFVVGKSLCPSSEVADTVRETLISPEFLKKFAEAFANTELPTTISAISQ